MLSQRSDAMTSFDGSTIDEQSPTDPSLIGDFRMIYMQEVPTEMHCFENEIYGATKIAMIKIKLFIKISDDTNTTFNRHFNKTYQPSIQKFKIELSDESDLFFHLIHEVTEDEYQDIQKSQNLTMSFVEYPSILTNMLNHCVKKHDNKNLLVLLQNEHNKDESELKFVQAFDFKSLELMTLKFKKTCQETREAHIKYRYFKLQQDIIILQEKNEFIFNVVKIKNPSLLLQIETSLVNMFDSDSGENFFEI